MAPGDIHLASFPFGDAPGMKLRPVLLLTRPLGPFREVLVAYISSVVPPAPLVTDLLIEPSEPEFTVTRLKTTSVLRLHKLATIHARSLARLLGHLPPARLADVRGKLRAMLEL
jgi:mRNA interferase MazF